MERKGTVLLIIFIVFQMSLQLDASPRLHNEAALGWKNIAKTRLGSRELRAPPTFSGRDIMLNNLQEEESEDGIPESEYPEVNNPEVNYPEVNYPEVESQNVLTKEDKSAEQNTPEMEVLEEVVTKDGVPEVFNPKADKPQNDHRQDRSSTYDNYPKSEIPKTFDMDYLKTLFEQDKQLEKESLVDEYENFLKYGYINLTAIEYAKMQNSPCSKKPLNPARASKDGRLFYKVECLHTALAGCHDVTNGSRCKKIIQRRGNGFHVVGCECVKRSG